MKQSMIINHAAPTRLYLMQVANFPVPPAGIPVVCYLIETGDGKHILIDSGLPEGFVSPPGLPPAEHGPNVLAQLASLGLSPDDIDLLICTHFDIDHVGYQSFFPNAQVIAQRRGYEHAQSSDNRRFSTGCEQWNHPNMHYRLIDGDTELLPGLKLIETSGHTIGHQSVLLHLPHTGAVLLAIDAVLMHSYFRLDREVQLTDEDGEAARASTIKLLSLARHKAASIVFGHDGQQWQALKKLPAFYD